MRALAALRAIAGPQSPLAAQEAAALAWSDDAHVQENRQKYGEKFAAAETLFAGCYDFYRPAGGFFFGSMWAMEKRPRGTCGLRKGCGCCPAPILRAMTRAAIIRRAPIFAWRWLMSKKQ